MPRAWVELATTLLVERATTVLVGTRALLGEGWNCSPLNVLVDMTVATAGVSVQQMRGRTLRLDRADPLKVASNWEIVCVAPALTRGRADYVRFAHKHLRLFGPAEDGAVETGPSHAHLELGPFTPPPAERIAALNAIALERAADRETARERWLIGTPYRGVELPTLLVRRLDEPSAPPLPLEAAARAVADAYRDLGELSEEAASSLLIKPRSGGYERCALSAATTLEGRRFVTALNELCSGPAATDLLISRPLGGMRVLGRVLRRTAHRDERLHTVPGDFARDELRAEAFARTWRRHVGPGRLIEGSGERPPDGGYETLVRDIWV